MIELRHLTKKFGSVSAVNDLNAKIKSGEVLSIIGQNGAGKTTTFRMLLGFINADSGSIIWDNNIDKKNRRIITGFLPEERGLYQKWSIREQIVYLSKLHGMSKKDSIIELKKCMHRLQVVGEIDDKIQSLSKGNAQKVQFISTIIFKPKILILDEPFTGLDPLNSEIIMKEILNLKKKGVAIVFSSHDMSGVEKISDKIIMLNKGNCVLSGTPKNIRNSFGNTEIYIESDISNDEIMRIKGVKNIQNLKDIRRIQLSNPRAGKDVFNLLSRKGYIKQFSQQPPTLNEIFKYKAKEL
ncbi:MAG: ATP-binding cassette domain-containing protein [Apilactobacillus sp.]|uniref:ABC transporter ATP-binding protein n=1 Tax=Apilactobacillus kunkeei TaxID=148814 RepID=UPI0030EAC74C|nr:ATP-binding cassette domain-containing protein [Apilactobacillus sp.]